MSLIDKVYKENALHIRHQVDEEHDGMRLDQFLGLYLESFSREVIKKKIKDKEIVITGRPGTHKPSTPVHFRDEVIIKFFQSTLEDEHWQGKKLELQTSPEIVYEDQDLLVISKPAFMATHPSGRHLFNCATVFFEKKLGHTIHSLHRIDRETSGILMLGKNPKMATQMMVNFEDDDIKKCYLFIGKIQKEFQSQDFFIANERLDSPESGLRRVEVVAYPENSERGKHARTFFYILEKTPKYIIGLACPQTGRQHQIRVHAKVHGIPLIGDKMYLGSYEMFQRFKDHLATPEDHDLMELPRHALHAIALKIPYQGDKKLFLTKIPQDLKEWILQKTHLTIDHLEEKIGATVNLYYSTHGSK